MGAIVERAVSLIEEAAVILICQLLSVCLIYCFERNYLKESVLAQNLSPIQDGNHQV